MTTHPATHPPALAGLRVRPYRGPDDLPAIVKVTNAEHEADRLPWRTTPEELAAEYNHPSDQFDPARDVRVAELDGEVVAFTDLTWVDTTDGLREYRVSGAVHPDWRRRGIGTSLLHQNETRARALAATHDTDRPKVLGLFIGEHQAGRQAIAERAGYAPVRWFFEMARPLDEVPPMPALPEGIELRPVTADQMRQIFTADVEAFQDHWGGFDSSEESFQRWLDSPSLDLSLLLMAWDGDEVAAGVVNSIYSAENESLGQLRGWLDSVFTRRAWRHRGLARALIVRSLHLLKERGMTTAVLGVDAQNPSGALGLYERVGFAVESRGSAHRKPMEAASA
jgi:mycothiol synthase